MATTRRIRWRLWLSRRITARLRRGSVCVALGAPGRRLTIGRRGLIVRLGWPGAGIVISWRRSWRQLRADLLGQDGARAVRRRQR